MGYLPMWCSVLECGHAATPRARLTSRNGQHIVTASHFSDVPSKFYLVAQLVDLDPVAVELDPCCQSSPAGTVLARCGWQAWMNWKNTPRA
jgi:hypothetical protein